MNLGNVYQHMLVSDLCEMPRRLNMKQFTNEQNYTGKDHLYESGPLAPGAALVLQAGLELDSKVRRTACWRCLSEVMAISGCNTSPTRFPRTTACMGMEPPFVCADSTLVRSD
eukprot:gnl/TRDRNA2_/TRDRNA2_72168_c0_seq1.p2 gnl/TRDRNA2_/TRDRNA2_72168_c0~~gnl/TRDRNA2_/TRDRNA2_72168_c0_seq1.p2  ORF type:complete len:113 (+),score=6.13 gnl/TRDRNA2_/TRDRNA2_72168_c0_seq1:226-564(+)